MNRGFSFRRTAAILVKEFIQMRRDRFTFGLMVMVPVMQLILFGFAINSDPKSLPTAVHLAEDSRYARSIVAALANSGYFAIRARAATPADGTRMLREGDVVFVVTVPPNFSRDLVRGQQPQLLIEADATDPAAASNALAAVQRLASDALRDDLEGPLAVRRHPPALQ
jgi:ABC-2 type transport system permease protein